jgi:Zn-dependent peptidase ImmA (M78 family)/transcriptional regulator with XRE-family HTH domain
MSSTGDMLRLARQLRRFQQTEAAKRLGIDQSLLSRLENGLVEVRDEYVLAASNIYELPRSFFEQKQPVYGAPVSVHPMWRKKADVSAKDTDSIIAELNVRVMHLRRLLEGAQVANTSDMPRMDIEEYGEPEKIASLVRAHWRVPSGPIKNLTLLAEKAGVIVVHSDLGGASISGVRFSAPGLPTLIALNKDQPADRMRFSLAHELGHLIMHRFPTADMENEANAFAVALLMPTVDIRPYFIGRRIDLALLASLKPEWKVSMAALLMRAHKLKFITDNRHTYLWKQISARGYRLREPPETDFPHEQPDVLEKILRLHLDSLGYTKLDLSKILHVHEHDLRRLYGIGEIQKTDSRITILK